MPRLGTARIPLVFQPRPLDVFIFGGQSNSRAIGGHSGNVPVNLSTPNPKVQIWNIINQRWETYAAGVNSDTAGGGVETDLWGPEGEFARRWSAANPGRTCYIVKMGINSSGLNDRWIPSANDLFQDFELEIKKALGRLNGRARVWAICWEQGGTDAETSDDAAAYEANLITLIGAARQRWGQWSSKFIFGMVRADYGDFASVVQQAQQDVADTFSSAGVGIYYNDDRTLIDEAHWNGDGVVNCGQDMYELFVGSYSALPAQFGGGDWSITPGDTLLTINVGSLPASNGALILDIEYRVDGGSWVSSGGISSFNITGLTNTTEYDVELRARNWAGVGVASASKAGTPAAAGGGTVDVTYLSTQVDPTADTGEYVFAGISTGTAAADRKMVVGLAMGRVIGATDPTVTFGGVAMTLVAEQVSVASGGVEAYLAWFVCDLPTGTTATLDITISGDYLNCLAAVYRTVGMATPAIDSQGVTVVPNGGSSSVNVDAVNGGAVFALGMTFLNSSSTLHTWTGVTKQNEQNVGTVLDISHGFHEASANETPRSVSCTHGMSGSAGTDGFVALSASFDAV
jgi:hypothetical protein